MVVIYRSRYCNDMELRFTKSLGISGKVNRGLLNGIVSDFSCRILSLLVKIYLRCIEVKAYDLDRLRKCHCYRHSYISKSYE